MPEIRFMGFTDAWVQRALGEVFEQTSEYVNPKEDNIELWSLTVEKGLTPKTERYNREFLVKKEDSFKTVFPSEFIYNPMNMTLGAIDLNLMAKKVAVSGYYITMRTKEGFDDNYFSVWLKSPKAIKLYKLYATGGLLEKQRVQFSTLSSICAVMPTLSEQTAIGNFFRTLDNCIAINQRKHDGLKKLKAAYLQQMFPQAGERVPRVRFGGFVGDWEERKLYDVAETYSGGTPSVGEKGYYNGIIPFIRSAEINSDQTELFLSNEGLQNSSAKMVDAGTILYALYGATSGEVGRSKIVGAINQAILAIKPKDSYNSEFIAQWLRRQKASIVSTYLQGGQGNLSASIIKELNINIPSPEEQTIIGNFFFKLDMQIETQEQKNEILKRLKAAYLQKMFV